MNDADRVCDEECLFSRYVALTYIPGGGLLTGFIGQHFTNKKTECLLPSRLLSRFFCY